MLELCSQLCPTPEERDKLLTFDGEEVEKLRAIEKEILPFANVARLAARLRVLKIRLRIAEDAGDLIQRVRRVKQALQQPRESAVLRLVLMYVLAIGNYINHGLKGKEIEDGVLGFRVESLPKLKDFRATAVRGVSLVHVLIAHLGHPKLQDDKLFEVSALTKVRAPRMHLNTSKARGKCVRHVLAAKPLCKLLFASDNNCSVHLLRKVCGDVSTL